MGGFIAVLGGRGAANAALAGARAMSRADGDAELVVDTDAVALAIPAGGRGSAVDPQTGRVAVVSGEIVLGERTLREAEAARALLDLPQTAPEEIEPPDGHYTAAVWDPTRRRLTSWTDDLGSATLFRARARGSLLVATELKGLVGGGLRPELDLRGWAEILAYEHALGERTPLLGAVLVGPATMIVADADGMLASHTRRGHQWDPAAEGDLDELVRELGALLDTAVTRRIDRHVGLALSGGLDSRALATVVARHARWVPSFTFGGVGADEPKRAAAVARALGLRHERLLLEPGYIAREAEQVVWLSEGRIRCFHAHHRILTSLVATHGLDALLVGYAGDAVLRWPRWIAAPDDADHDRLVSHLHGPLRVGLDDTLAAQVLTPAFAGELQGQARSGLAEALARTEGPADVRAATFRLREVFPHKIVPGTRLFTDVLAQRDALADRDLLRFLARLPRTALVEGALQRAYLRATPGVSHIRNPDDGLAPGVTGRRKELARLSVGIRRRATGHLEGAARRLGVQPHRGVGDYAADLRRQGGARLLGILLEPRTLERGQLRPEPVRRMIDATLGGRRPFTHVLGLLVTLELFQRQFLDGEHFPASTVAPEEPLRAVEPSPA